MHFFIGVFTRVVHDSQVGYVSIIYTNILQECSLLYVFLIRCLLYLHKILRDYAYPNSPLPYLVKNNPSLHCAHKPGLQILSYGVMHMMDMQ